MPRYLGLDYTSEALKEHRGFLGAFLLALPTHLGSYKRTKSTGGYEETFDDLGYRLPWLQVKDKRFLRTVFKQEELQESLTQLLQPRKRADIEQFASRTKSVSAIPSIHVDDCDIVPSSNPDSPPVDSQIKQSLRLQFCKKPDAICIPDHVEDDTIPDDNKDLSGLLEEPCHASAAPRLVQTCSELCQQLTPMTIKDPFADIPKERGIEKLYQWKERQSLHTSFTEEIVKEEVLLDDIPGSVSRDHKDVLLSEVISVSLTEVSQPSVTELVSKKCSKEEHKDLKGFDCTHTDFLEPPLVAAFVKNQPECLPHVSTSDSDVITLNHEGMPAAVEQAAHEGERVSLEIPRTPVDSSPSSEDGKEQPEKLPLTPVCCFDAEIVTPKTRLAAEEKVRKLEQSLHEAVALSLKVPDVAADGKAGIGPLPLPITKLMLSKEKQSSETELMVPWQPVSISQSVMKKYNRSVEKMNCDATPRNLDTTSIVNEMVQEEIQQVDVVLGGDEADKLLEVQLFDDKKDKQTNERLVAGIAEYTRDAEGKESVVQSVEPHRLKCVEAELTKTMRAAPNLNVEAKQQPSLKSDMEMIKEKNPTCVSSVKPKIDLRASLCGDPLDIFLKLRCKQSVILKDISSLPVPQSAPPPPPPLPPGGKGDVTDKPGPHQDIAEQMLEPLANPDKVVNVSDEGRAGQVEAVPVKADNKKTKSRQVEVQLTAPFVAMVRLLREAASPVVNQLHGTNALSPSYTLDTLTTDITRFLLLQHEKQYYSKDTALSENYKSIIVLHSCVTATDLLTHCDAATAIRQLAFFSEKYKDILQGCLESLRSHLFRQQCILPRETLHPKLAEMARLVGEWFQKKLKKEGTDHEPKVLVIIRRDIANLAENVVSMLSSVKGLLASTLPCSAGQSTYVTVSEALDKHNVLVITSSQMDHVFPWAHFSLVVEYEACPRSPWKELCLRQRIRHIELHCITHTTAQSQLDSVGITDNNKGEKGHAKEEVPVLKLIGSEQIINSSKLLQTLESRHNILIVERSFSPSQTFPLSAQPCADLILDERTGIIVRDLAGLLEEGSVEPLVRQITILSQQFTILWLIMQSNDHNNRYALGGYVVTNTAKLQAALAQFSPKTHDFQVKVMYSADSASTAATIRLICDVSQQASAAVWHWEDWLARPWLTERLSKHEKFLSRFSCLNSFSSQVMLTAAPLPVLLSAPITHLIQLCPWIPPRILMSFFKLVHHVQPSSFQHDISGDEHVKKTEELASRGGNMEGRCVPQQGNITAERHRYHQNERETYDPFHPQQQDHEASSVSAEQHAAAHRGWRTKQEGDEKANAGSEDTDQWLNAKPVQIKSEPLDDPVEDKDSLRHDPCSLQHSIPDDLKTPLELLASCEKYRYEQYYSNPDREVYHTAINKSDYANSSSIKCKENAYLPDRYTLDSDCERSARSRCKAYLYDPRDSAARGHITDRISDQPQAQFSSFHEREDPCNIMPASARRHASMRSAPTASHPVHAPVNTRGSYATHDAASLEQDVLCDRGQSSRQSMLGDDRWMDYTQRRHVQGHFARRDTQPDYHEGLSQHHPSNQLTRVQAVAPRRYVGVAQPCPRPAGGLQETDTGRGRGRGSSCGGVTQATHTAPEDRGPCVVPLAQQQYQQQHDLQDCLQDRYKQPHHSLAQQLGHTDMWRKAAVHGVSVPGLEMAGYGRVSLHKSGAVRREGVKDDHQTHAGSYQDEACVMDSPSKKRRLRYERVPGAKGGQTRLIFK